jgi:mannose-6-phosphate isomerase-like protein (cupin superfamily)
MTPPVIIRHESDAPCERSTCGHRYRLLSQQDPGVAAWAHVVDVDGSRAHYHRQTTEIYYVLEGEGGMMLDGVEHPIRKGSIVHIPPDVVHSAKGRMRVLVVGVPDIRDDDVFFPEITPVSTK